MPYLLRLWFGVSEPVGRKAYAVSGFALLLFKYSVETLVIWISASALFLPWQFLNPVLSVRTEMLHSAPPWVGWSLFIWSLPFLWIALSMSVRRAADSGRSPWLGLVILVPLINLIFMLWMCCLPTDPEQRWSPASRPVPGKSDAKHAVIALGISLMLGAAMMMVSVLLLESYGASLFLGTPLLMGAVASYVYNRAAAHGYAAAVGLGIAAVGVGGAGLLLFALEGLICVAMAVPLMVPLGALGGLLGKAIADSARPNGREVMAALLVLPVLTLAEARFASTTEYKVTTSVEMEAPAETVWKYVIDFPDLPPPTAWYFRMGIAYPCRARIFGRGVGATRHCEFTTGTFVEPITAWDPARRLAFEVTDQPPPMFELSPYHNLHPPHLDGYLRSTRGEFRLIPLPGHRTRVEGSTWYEINMFPQAYWTLWSNQIIHRIHLRVLTHIQQLAEGRQ